MDDGAALGGGASEGGAPAEGEPGAGGPVAGGPVAGEHQMGVLPVGRTMWGRADDGSLVEVELGPDAADADMSVWWPPMGLELVDPPSHPPVSASVTTFRVVSDTPAAWDRLESDIGLFVAERLDALVAVHAAVIRADDVVLVIPGPSYAGKTSLCVAALDRGFDVLSDEYALVDPTTGMVVGWPRQLRVRTPDGGAKRVGDVVGSGQSAGVPCDVDLVAAVTYSAEVDQLTVETVSAAEATLTLLANTVCASSRPEFAFSGVLALGRDVAAVTGQRGEAQQALAALVDLARSHNPQD